MNSLQDIDEENENHKHSVSEIKYHTSHFSEVLEKKKVLLFYEYYNNGSRPRFCDFLMKFVSWRGYLSA